jgi:deoxyribodipyrimidine photo-lyase
MQASQREEVNHALEFAVREANRLKLPVLAVFGLTDEYPEANERHYAFMLEGLRETQQALRKRGVELVIREAEPDDAALELAPDAALVVTDRGYTSFQRRWRRRVAARVACRVVQVETDVVVPVGVASGKAEYAARTLRPKIHRHLSEYLVPLEPTRLRRDSLGMGLGSLDIEDTAAVLGQLRLDRSVQRVRTFLGGTSRAKVLLREFLDTKLDHYASRRNEPSKDIQSHQSPYLHFGQISPLYVALEAMAAAGDARDPIDAYLEELVVRRELAVNFVQHCSRYRSYRCLPGWARATLRAHQKDRRPFVYALAQLERAQTHDPYWNAAMREMLVTGKMHNYMRMYWGKKIIEWTRRPQTAFRWALYLNNKYFLDGRDPNSWAGVAWCFGLHDRPWGERPVFGTVRYMNAAGLERKFDMEEYIRKVDGLY